MANKSDINGVLQLAQSINYLRTLKHYIEDRCRNDPAVLNSSGFHAASSARNNSALANPMILSIDFSPSIQDC
jgi:hypothetical protein